MYSFQDPPYAQTNLIHTTTYHIKYTVNSMQSKACNLQKINVFTTAIQNDVLCKKNNSQNI